MVHVTLHKSTLMAAVIFFTNLGAIVCTIFLPMSSIIKIILGSICITNLCTTLTRYAFLKSSKSIMKFWLKEDGIWQLQNTKGEIDLAVLDKTSIITTFFTLLNFQCIEAEKKLSIPMCCDALPEDDFRKLRIILRYCDLTHESKKLI